jgi:hypothetical protein
MIANPTVFDQRECAFEKKFAQDEEKLFKAHARRNRLIGQWAAEKLGMSGTDAESYAKALVTIDMDKPGRTRSSASFAPISTAGALFSPAVRSGG